MPKIRRIGEAEYHKLDSPKRCTTVSCQTHSFSVRSCQSKGKLPLTIMKMLLFFFQNLFFERAEHQICVARACLILQHTGVLHVWGTCLSKNVPVLCLLGKLGHDGDGLQVAPVYVVSQSFTVFPPWTVFPMPCVSELHSLINHRELKIFISWPTSLQRKYWHMHYSASPELPWKCGGPPSLRTGLKEIVSLHACAQAWVGTWCWAFMYLTN